MARRQRWRDGALLAAGVAAATLPGVAVGLQPREAGPVAVLFAPGRDAEAGVRGVWSAGGLALATGAGGALVIAAPSTSDDRNAFFERLRAAGAVLIMDGAALGRLCRPLD